MCRAAQPAVRTTQESAPTLYACACGGTWQTLAICWHGLRHNILIDKIGMNLFVFTERPCGSKPHAHGLRWVFQVSPVESSSGAAFLRRDKRVCIGSNVSLQ